MLDDANQAFLDALDPEDASRSKGVSRTCRVYRPISAGDRLVWLDRLRRYGPRHDFRYRNDDPFTEALRDRYNAIVTDPSVRSEPRLVAAEDVDSLVTELLEQEPDWDGWNDSF